MLEQNSNKTLSKEVDLLPFIAKVVCKWKLILKVSVCFMVLGVVMAFSSIKSYTAQVLMAPEAAAYGGSAELDALVAFTGLDMGEKGDAIYPLLYPEIINSLPFLCSLLDVHVKSVDGSVDTTYVHYVKKIRKKSWVDKVKAYPKKTVNKIVALFKDKESIGNPNVFNPYHLSKSQMIAVEALKNRINVLVDKKTEVITLSFTEQDPLIAAIMVDAIKERLQERITEYQTKKAIADCDYFEKLYLESKREYELAQEVYAVYVDRNRNVTQERFLIEKERLAADRDLKNSLYMQWTQQLQLAKAKVQENTPAFTTLKPASVPVFPSSMGRLMMVLVYTFVGAMLASLYILLKDDAVSIYHELFKKN